MSTLIGLAVLIIFGIPALSFLITMGIFTQLLMWAITIAIFGYILGIPWSIWFRWHNGRWPEAD